MSEKVFTVTCFGDSITEGIGACPMDGMSYPAQLQRLLGDGYAVLNMGASGLTLQREGDYPYYKDPRYEAAFASDPDAVLLMIGTTIPKTTTGIRTGTKRLCARRSNDSWRCLPARLSCFLPAVPPFPTSTLFRTR